MIAAEMKTTGKTWTGSNGNLWSQLSLMCHLGMMRILYIFLDFAFYMFGTNGRKTLTKKG